MLSGFHKKPGSAELLSPIMLPLENHAGRSFCSPFQPTVTHTRQDLGHQGNTKSPSGAFGKFMKMTHSPRNTHLEQPPMGPWGHLHPWLGDRSNRVRLKGPSGVRSKTQRQHPPDRTEWGSIYPLITQGPSFSWQSLPENPGAQEHSYWPPSRSTQVPLLEHGVEVQALTSGAQEKIPP